MNDKKDQLKNHSYDGIQEYDNDLPKWWLVTFFLTIIFALFYWSKYFVFTHEDSQQTEYASLYEAHQKKYLSNIKVVEDETIIAMVHDEIVMKKTREVFKQYCSACHGTKGEGGIGPNLTDEAWIHGYEPGKIVKVINQGVQEKGMTAWKGVLSNTQINELAAYIISLEGSAPEKAKDSQGEIIKP